MLRACLTASLAVSLTACNGSSKGPALLRADAHPLAALATQIQHEGACAQRHDIQRLQQQAQNLVNSRRVPEELQEPLMSGVNALAADSPPCVPPVPVQPAPPPQPPPKHEKHDHPHDHHDKHEKKHH